MGEIVQKINIEQVLRGIGVTEVETVNPLELEASVECVQSMAERSGVKAIIFKAPCIAVTKPAPLHVVRVPVSAVKNVSVIWAVRRL